MTSMSAISAAGADEQLFLLRQDGEPALSVHHVRGRGPTLLYVHGSTFPAALSIGYRIDGRSWADDLSERGFDVWSFDLPGYGGSERWHSMQLPTISRDEVPGRAADTARQIERVARRIRESTDRERISILAHSWGSIPAGMFAGSRPDSVDRLVLFGPIAQRDGGEPETCPMGPATLVSASDQWRSFQSRSPEDAPLPIAKERFDAWADAYLSSDRTSGERKPPSVKVPSGPEQDFNQAWNGRFPYDPATVRAPTLIVHGEWDSITRDKDAVWLASAMTNVPGGARVTKLPRGAHRMHLEDNRQALFDAVAEFLSQDRR